MVQSNVLHLSIKFGLIGQIWITQEDYCLVAKVDNKKVQYFRYWSIPKFRGNDTQRTLLQANRPSQCHVAFERL